MTDTDMGCDTRGPNKCGTTVYSYIRLHIIYSDRYLLVLHSELEAAILRFIIHTHTRCPSVCPADRLTHPPPPLTSLTPLTPLMAPCVPQAIVAVIGLSVLAFGLQTDKDIARALGAPPSSDGRPMGSH